MLPLGGLHGKRAACEVSLSEKRIIATTETSSGSSELRLRLYCDIGGIYRLFKVTVLAMESREEGEALSTPL
jgi:hypothetical protein